MGKHFDSLVEIVRADQKRERKLLPDHLARTVERATLFELPYLASQVLDLKGVRGDDATEYISKYIQISYQHSKDLLIPFPVTALENPNFLTIIDTRKPPALMVTVWGQYLKMDKFRNDPLPTGLGDFHHLTTGPIEIIDGTRIGDDEKAFFATYRSGAWDRPDLEALAKVGRAAVSHDFLRATASCIIETIYLMDPENWIVKAESTLSRQQDDREKRRCSKGAVLRKSEVRPRYLCTTTHGLREFLADRSKDPCAAHPVAGYWRTYTSERFTRMRGQVQQIGQYMTGDGVIMGKNNVRYTVMVKLPGGEVVPYSPALFRNGPQVPAAKA